MAAMPSWRVGNTCNRELEQSGATRRGMMYLIIDRNDRQCMDHRFWGQLFAGLGLVDEDKRGYYNPSLFFSFSHFSTDVLGQRVTNIHICRDKPEFLATLNAMSAFFHPRNTSRRAWELPNPAAAGGSMNWYSTWLKS